MNEFSIRVFVLGVTALACGSASAFAQVCNGGMDFRPGRSVQLRTSAAAAWGPTSAVSGAGGVAAGRGPMFGSVELGGNRFAEYDSGGPFFNAAIGASASLTRERRLTICPSYSYRRELTTQTSKGPFGETDLHWLTVAHTVDLSLGFEAARVGRFSLLPFVQGGHSRLHDATNLIHAPGEFSESSGISFFSAGLGAANARVSVAALATFRKVKAPNEAFRTLQIRAAVALGRR